MASIFKSLLFHWSRTVPVHLYRLREAPESLLGLNKITYDKK